MSQTPTILVIDDEPRIRTLLRRYLTGEGFKIREAGDGEGMRAEFALGSVDLVLLDLMMPGEDGLTLARWIRQQSDVPIIMLTGKGDLIDRVVGLESGADDYITKPFELREVLARIRTVMRRPRVQPAPAASAAAGEGGAREVLAFLGWRLDLSRRALTDPEGTPVPLTGGEFALLRAFVLNPNRVLDRDRLMDLVKGRDWVANDRAIDTQVVRLRGKIEPDPANPILIKTVRGAGYVFSAPVTAG